MAPILSAVGIPHGDSTTEADVEQEAHRILEAFRGQRMFAPLPLHPKAWDRARQLATEHPTGNDVYDSWQAVKRARENGASAALDILIADFELKLQRWLNS